MKHQKTITINGIEVPEPMRVAPESGAQYWLAITHSSVEKYYFLWSDNPVSKKFLAQGLCHSTKEAAMQHRRALILASGGDPDYKG